MVPEEWQLMLISDHHIYVCTPRTHTHSHKKVSLLIQYSEGVPFLSDFLFGNVILTSEHAQIWMNHILSLILHFTLHLKIYFHISITDAGEVFHPQLSEGNVI